MPKISEDGKKIYYHNYFDNKAIYSYDLTTGIYKKLLDSANEFEIAADRYLLLTSSGYLKDYTLYDLQEGTVEDIPTTVTISKIYLSPQGDVFVCTTGSSLTLYAYSNGTYASLCTDSKYSNYGFDSCEMKFSASGEYAVFASKYDQKNQSLNILKKINGVWTTIIHPSYPWYQDKDREIKTNFCIPNDGGKLLYTKENDLYKKIHKIDLVSGAHSLLMDGTEEIKGTLIQVCDDGRVLYADEESYIYLLDTVTGEKQKPLHNKLDYEVVRYISNENKIVYMAANYMIGQTIVDESDLAALVEDYSPTAAAEQPKPKASASPEPTQTEQEQPKQTEHKKGGSPMLYIFLALIAAGVIGGYYYKVILPKKKLADADDIDGFEFEDNTEEVENEDDIYPEVNIDNK